MAEFLPLCDVLFNVISLAGYFCDVVFDVVMGYALLERGYKGTFAAAISIVITSLLISQVVSLRWYLHVWWAGAGGARRGRVPWGPLVLHCAALGVVWRYARLLAPVDPARVKHQVRDLCMLRLVHAFSSAAPMLLLQLHVLVRQREQAADTARDEPAANAAFAELNVISAALSLFSVCWALASFSKNVRRHNVHRLLLTWLGVIFQFLWRLGTISARVCALTVYALVYEYWVFLVIGLHWLSMFLWLISPKSVFHGERISCARKAALSALIAFVYVFAYINLQELNHRQKMVTFYVVMVIENSLLLAAYWWAGGSARPAPLSLAAGAFTAGIGFMLLYYRYFHVRRLGYMLGEQAGTNSTTASNKPPPAASVPGVFNCRFSNPVTSAAIGRKKKKPTSFVPPPAPAPLPPPAPAAFWRRPHQHNHHGGSSENEGSSVGSRVNIQQKLQEKKQKQLAELRVIEEEIKQGKLAKTTPPAADEIYSSLQRQPIPRAKTHVEPAWAHDLTHPYQNYPILPHTCNIYPTYTEIKPEYVQNFTDNPTDLNDPLKLRRLNVNRTFYENPVNIRNGINVNRTPIRSPNYLIGEQTYETNCNSHNVLNSSPRNFIDVTNNYESNIDEPRIQSNGNIYSEDRQMEYSGYCENGQNYSKYESKDAYVSALQSALASVQSMESPVLRPAYEPCGGYSQCARPPNAGVGVGAKKTELLRKMQRCRTPEILLAPHYLEGCSRQVCCHWGPPYSNRKKEEGSSSGDESAGSRERPAKDTPRPHSDIDSQISLPRSYTLPREFRYWRRRHQHRASNNSSDGDVDSADNESVRSLSSVISGCGGAHEFRPAPPAPARRRPLARRHKPETRL